MCFIDLDPCEVWCETERKARKQHRCSCCQDAIEPGQKYLVHFSVFEGNKMCDKMCLTCRDDRAAFASAHGGTLCAPSYFPDMLWECIAENDPDDQRWAAMNERINGDYLR